MRCKAIKQTNTQFPVFQFIVINGLIYNVFLYFSPLFLIFRFRPRKNNCSTNNSNNRTTSFQFLQLFNGFCSLLVSISIWNLLISVCFQYLTINQRMVSSSHTHVIKFTTTSVINQIFIFIITTIIVFISLFLFFSFLIFLSSNSSVFVA